MIPSTPSTFIHHFHTVSHWWLCVPTISAEAFPSNFLVKEIRQNSLGPDELHKKLQTTVFGQLQMPNNKQPYGITNMKKPPTAKKAESGWTNNTPEPKSKNGITSIETNKCYQRPYQPSGLPNVMCFSMASARYPCVDMYLTWLLLAGALPVGVMCFRHKFRVTGHGNNRLARIE